MNNLLKRQRMTYPLTQAGAARRIGVHLNTYRRVEQGKPCDVGTAYKIARFFGISVFELMPKPVSFLQKRRYAKGMTQKQLAFLVGVDEHTIIRWEKGTTKPNKSKKLDLERVLDPRSTCVSANRINRKEI